ncbi:SRPBCC family protein [Taibaiella chishuiensis]|uniref:Uncharacterized protein YndB with AHSA1/START domain n=1 Tax=Taibaiella chishuiensis TaxID=1434707 RepID=A0A2P8D2M1_9BACT|nr:SRPBCC domain-containing protein [Taibaiella chishuiensis]PSK91439.1 uncharacterized protein YndB with AHSA1/START domain [Taibaiella chishuiensis]
METKPLILEYTYAAPPTQVWQALTDPAHMKAWYFDIPGFKPEPGFRFSFSAGSPEQQYVHQCRITEALAPETLAYTWAYEGYKGSSEVCFTLYPEDGQTRLVLEHEGLDSFPQEPAFARDSFLQGWTMILGTNLKQYLEQRKGSS